MRTCCHGGTAIRIKVEHAGRVNDAVVAEVESGPKKMALSPVAVLMGSKMKFHQSREISVREPVLLT